MSAVYTLSTRARQISSHVPVPKFRPQVSPKFPSFKGYEHYFCSCDSPEDRAAYKRYISGATYEDEVLAPMLAGGVYGGVRAGFRGIVGGFFRTGTKAAVEEVSAAVVEQVVSSGTKQAAKEALEQTALSDAAKATIKRALSRGAANNKYTIEKLSNGSVKVITEVTGRAGGRAEYVKIIDGTTGVTKSFTQNAFDAAGNLVHHDPKL